MRKENIHGSVKMRVDCDGCKDSQVSQQDYQVNQQEHHKEEDLKVWVTGES